MYNFKRVIPLSRSDAELKVTFIESENINKMLPPFHLPVIPDDSFR